MFFFCTCAVDSRQQSGADSEPSHRNLAHYRTLINAPIHLIAFGAVAPSSAVVRAVLLQRVEDLSSPGVLRCSAVWRSNLIDRGMKGDVAYWHTTLPHAPSDSLTPSERVEISRCLPRKRGEGTTTASACVVGAQESFNFAGTRASLLRRAPRMRSIANQLPPRSVLTEERTGHLEERWLCRKFDWRGSPCALPA